MIFTKINSAHILQRNCKEPYVYDLLFFLETSLGESFRLIYFHEAFVLKNISREQHSSVDEDIKTCLKLLREGLCSTCRKFCTTENFDAIFTILTQAHFPLVHSTRCTG